MFYYICVCIYTYTYINTDHFHLAVLQMRFRDSYEITQPLIGSRFQFHFDATACGLCTTSHITPNYSLEKYLKTESRKEMKNF